MKKIVLSVTNDLITDQRVHKVATTLMVKGFQVMLVGRLLPRSLPVNRNYATHRMNLLFNKGPFFYAEYNIRLFIILLFIQADIFVSNDLDTLPASFLAAQLKRKPLVYDSHEFFTGVPELQHRPRTRKIWEIIEKLIFRHLKNIYTVNNSISNLYQQKYHKPVIVVRNVPFRLSKTFPDSIELTDLPVDKKIIILQGAGINVNRGAEEAIRAMIYIDNARLLIIGGGDVLEVLTKMVNTLDLNDKVIFKPRMPYMEMMHYTRQAHLGLTLDKDTNINYRFSLPNKLFDYIQAEIPVLCTDLVEVAGIVKQYDIGRIAENLEACYLGGLMTEMLTDDHQRQLWKQNLSRTAEILCWENEEAELMKIYGQFVNQG